MLKANFTAYIQHTCYVCVDRESEPRSRVAFNKRVFTLCTLLISNFNCILLMFIFSYKSFMCSNEKIPLYRFLNIYFPLNRIYEFIKPVCL